MAELWWKLRTSFLLYVSMILLAYLIKKFEYIRPLLHDMRVMLHYKDNSTGEIKKVKALMEMKIRDIHLQIFKYI